MVSFRAFHILVNILLDISQGSHCESRLFNIRFRQSFHPQAVCPLLEVVIVCIGQEFAAGFKTVAGGQKDERMRWVVICASLCKESGCLTSANCIEKGQEAESALAQGRLRLETSFGDYLGNWRHLRLLAANTEEGVIIGVSGVQL